MAIFENKEVAEAIAQGGFSPSELDERGLVPLKIAREALSQRTSFSKGQSHQTHGRHLLTSDVLWALLLSLQDAAEFVEVASKLTWNFHPRGMNNIDLFLRYGAGIVPWLATRLNRDGVLENNPWCVLPCLMQCDSKEAFDLVWSIRTKPGDSPGVLLQWIDTHAQTAARSLVGKLLASRAISNNDEQIRTRAVLAGFIARGFAGQVENAIEMVEMELQKGQDLANQKMALRQELGLHGPPTREAVLALLDAASSRVLSAKQLMWPDEKDGPNGKCHALRAVALRQGEQWGLLLQRLEGDRPGGSFGARVFSFCFGSGIRPGSGKMGGVKMVPVMLQKEAIDGAPSSEKAFHTWVQNQLMSDEKSNQLWGPVSRYYSVLGFNETARVVATVPHLAFFGDQLPSEITTYQGLAKAIVLS